MFNVHFDVYRVSRGSGGISGISGRARMSAAVNASLNAAINAALDDVKEYLDNLKMSIFQEQAWAPLKSERYRAWKIKNGYGDMIYKKTGDLLQSMKGSKVSYNHLKWGILGNEYAATKMFMNEVGAHGSAKRLFFSRIAKESRGPIMQILKNAILRSIG